jgi:predicted O-methyltransferase YrrM
MKRVLIIVIVVAVIALFGTPIFVHHVDVASLLWSPALAAPSARTDSERQVLGVLKDMQENDKTFFSVEEETGRILRMLTEATGAKEVVEIGTSTGYSGLWICLALDKTHGHLTTFEIDHGRAEMARDNFKRAGVDQIVTVIEGDAHKRIVELTEPIDIAFLDADKGGYPDYIEKLLPQVRPGGLIVADNLNMATAYREAINKNPALETVYLGRRVSITMKKR